MKARMGAARAIGLAAATTLVAAGLGVVTTPTAQATGPALPGPTSSSWLAVTKAGVALTDASGDFTPTDLDMTAAGGTDGAATVFVSADLDYAYFRFHVAAQPGAGAYVVQFDTNQSDAGWERALRYDAGTKTVTLYTGAADSGVKDDGTAGISVPASQTAGTSYPGTTGAFVAFAVPRSSLDTADFKFGKASMVFGTSSAAGVALVNTSTLGLPPKPPTADLLGAKKTNTAWSAVASDVPVIDSDGDGLADSQDNCPRVPNADQADDDAAVDNSLPPGTVGQPDGTEGQGNACDKTPRGYDIDGDHVGLMDDACPEQYGALANGCVAQSTTTAILRYKARTKTFSGLVGADYDQCLPNRRVAVYRLVKGPDKQLGIVKSDATGHYKLVVTKRQPAGKYYSSVDPKWTLGARCFGVKSAKIQIG